MSKTSDSVELRAKFYEVITRLFAYGVDWTEHKDTNSDDHDVSTFAAKIKADFAKEVSNELVNICLSRERALLEELKDSLPQNDTDCSEFYMHDSPADDGCPPEEHARRSGRFDYKMEVEDLIEDKLKQGGE